MLNVFMGWLTRTIENNPTWVWFIGCVTIGLILGAVLS